MLREIFFGLDQSIFLFSSFEPTLFVVQLILARFFEPILYKFIVLGFLSLSPSIFWAREPNMVLT